MFAYGVTSSCVDDNSELLYLDWDNFLISKVQKECNHLINKFHLTDIIILRSSEGHNYLGYCLKKLYYLRKVRILRQTHCDFQFVEKHNKKFAYKTDLIRYSMKGNKPKPSLIMIIKSPYTNGIHSLAHAKFFLKHFQVPINPNYKYDDSNKVYVQRYKVGEAIG